MRWLGKRYEFNQGFCTSTRDTEVSQWNANAYTNLRSRLSRQAQSTAEGGTCPCFIAKHNRDLHAEAGRGRMKK